MASLNSSSAGLLLEPGFPLDDHGQAPGHNASYRLGRPTQRKRFEAVPLLATVISLLCLALSICIITSHLRIAWTLGFNGQIIAIGFLLGVMNLCLGVVVPHALLLLEFRFGKSTLQNYESLLANKVFRPRTDLVWRVVLAALIALPLGLSVAYKRFAGGSSSALVKNPGYIEYGIGFPRVDTWAPPNDALYLLSTALGPFISRTQDSDLRAPYDPVRFPLAFGYNTLLLSGGSAAILDTPTHSTVVSIRTERLRGNETWDLTATVDAYVATLDTESDFRTNNATWISTLKSNDDRGEDYRMYSMWFWYNNKKLGLMPSDDNNACYISMYNGSQGVDAMRAHNLMDATETMEYEGFRAAARKFNLTRAKCHGRWQLNATGIALIDGTCDQNSSAKSTVLQGQYMQPFAYDILPSISHPYKGFAKEDPELMPWLDATHAVSVVTFYWARAVYMIYDQGYSDSKWDGPYQSPNQTCTSTRPALADEAGLYVLLAVEPIITLIALFITAWLCHVPIGRGFGLISILSGYDSLTSLSIRGAGLSGDLDRRAAMEMTVTAPGSDSDHATEPEVQYRIAALSKHQPGVATELRSGQKYG